MTSTLGHAVLGLLARRPSTGYELARRMDRPVGWFWTARHSQIYPELARLEAAGLVRHDEVDGAGPRQSKRYAVTDEGLAALAAWVAGDLEPQPVRDLEVLRLWSVWTVEPDAAVALVRQVRRGHVDRLAAYEEELAQVRADPEARNPRHPAFASRVTLEGGVRTRRATVQWCDWLLEELAAATAGVPGGSS